MIPSRLSKREIRQFEQFTKLYHSRFSHMPYSSFFDLRQWSDFSKLNKEIGDKIFASVFDINLNFLFLDIDFLTYSSKYEHFFGNRKIENFSILNNQFDFFASLDILNSCSNFIIRYRSIWDKLMGLIVLLKDPNNYEIYRRAKSRKAKFVQLMNGKDLNGIKINNIKNNLEKFDNTFRTPEVHGTGAIRKWILNPKKYIDFNDFNSPIILAEYWNELIVIVDEINNWICKSKKQ